MLLGHLLHTTPSGLGSQPPQSGVQETVSAGSGETATTSFSWSSTIALDACSPRSRAFFVETSASARLSRFTSTCIQVYTYQTYEDGAYIQPDTTRLVVWFGGNLCKMLTSEQGPLLDCRR